MELTYQQAVNRLKDIKDELERLAARSEEPGLTPEDEAYWAKLVKEAREVEDHRKTLQRNADRDLIERMGTPDAPAGRLAVDDGSAPADTRNRPGTGPVKNPWDLSDIRSGLNPIEHASEMRHRALTAVEQMPTTTDERRKVMTDLIERRDNRRGDMAALALATSSEAYVRAFGKLISNQGNMSVLEHDEQQAVARAMSLTDNAGGYLVPFQLDPSIILTADGSFNEVRQMSRVVTATGDVWHGVSSAGVTSSWDGEGEEVSDDSPTLAQPTINIHKLQLFVPISIEALMDAQNVAQEVAGLIAFEKDTRESIAFVTGPGDASNQPYGVITRLGATTASKVSVTTNDTFGLPDLYKLDEQLPARYRNRASWLAHRAIYNDVRRFDTAGGAALWTQLPNDAPVNLLGKPAFQAEAMASTPSGTNKYFLAFGDFQNYVIADRLGTTVEYIPHLFGTNGRPTGQRGLVRLQPGGCRRGQHGRLPGARRRLILPGSHP